MGQVTIDGVIYEELPDGNLRVIGYADQGQPQAPQPQGMVIGTPRQPDPMDQRLDELRAQQALLNIQQTQQRMRIDAAQEDRASANGAGRGRVMRQGDADRLERDLASYGGLQSALRTFEDNFGGNPLGGLENWAQGYLPVGTEGQRDWWANFRSFDNQIRNDLFGATLTPAEQQSYAATSITPGMTGDEIRRNLERRIGIVRDSLGRRANRLVAGGFSEAEVRAALGDYAGDILPDQQAGAAPANAAGPTVHPRAAGTQADAGVQANGVAPRGQGAERVPELAGLGSQIARMFQRGASADEVVAYYRDRHRQAGTPPSASQEADIRWIGAAHARDPSKPVRGLMQGWDNFDMVVRNGPPSLLGQIADTAPGAAIIAASNAVSGGNLGNIAGDNAQGVLNYARQERPYSSLAGDVFGSGLAMYGGNAAAARLAPGAIRTALTGANGIGLDMGYGAFRGASEAEGGAQERALAALLGAGAAGAGNRLGVHVVAPAATAASSTRLGQAAINAGGRAVNAVNNARRGMFGRNPVPYQGINIPQSLARPERSIANAVNSDIATPLAALDGAQNLGLPMALADTSPSLQRLAGSAYRRAGTEVRDQATEQLRARSLGQRDRAQQAIADIFGPIDNPNEVSARLMERARRDAAPLYDSAFAQPGRTSPELQQMLDTPAGQRALQAAYGIAANERMSPNAMGFDLNDLGEVTLTSVPSLRTLDMVKRGFDDVLDTYRDPTSGRLALDNQGRAIEGLRQGFVSELDRLYPGDYAAARQAFAGPAAENNALARGRDAIRMAPRDVEVAANNLSPSQRDQFGLGFRVSLSDAVDRSRYSANPYENIFGSPVARERMNVVQPGSAARMEPIYQAEQAMQRTSNELLGGSPTASRVAADQEFGSGIAGQVVEHALNTGGAPIGTALRIGSNFLMDRVRLGLGQAAQRRADEILPVLLNDQPADAAAYLRDLFARSDARRGYVNRNRQRFGMFGAGVGAGLAAPQIAGQ